MRFIIRNNHDMDGITEEIVGLIENRYGIDYGAVFDFGDSKRKRRTDIEYLDYKFCTSNAIQMDEKVLSMPLPRNVLDGMLKYKSMVLNMVSRETHYNVYRLDYLENFYYERLRFWYGFITEKDIDFVLFLVPPHHAGEYVLYSLCELLNIKKVIMIGVQPEGSFIPVNSINEVGSSILRNTDSADPESEELNDIFSKYVNKVKSGRTYTKEEIRRVRKEFHRVMYYYDDTKKVLTALRRLFTIPLLPRNRDNREYEARENNRYLKMVWTIRREERHMDHLRDYNKLAVSPDLSKKFIFFPLQQEPEDTTMPRAGEFKNQVLSLLILSEAAKKLGITIYVKEHWVQEHREKGYYKKLANIDNVELVDLDFSSAELIKHSIAVASQTGSSIIEAMIWGGNSLIFGEGCPYIGCPGSYYIGDVTDVENAVNDIMKNGNGYSKSDSDRYLLGYQKSCISFYCDSLAETQSSYDTKGCAKRIFESIVESVG